MERFLLKSSPAGGEAEERPRKRWNKWFMMQDGAQNKKPWAWINNAGLQPKFLSKYLISEPPPLIAAPESLSVSVGFLYFSFNKSLWVVTSLLQQLCSPFKRSSSFSWWWWWHSLPPRRPRSLLASWLFSTHWGITFTHVSHVYLCVITQGKKTAPASHSSQQNNWISIFTGLFLAIIWHLSL